MIVRFVSALTVFFLLFSNSSTAQSNDNFNVAGVNDWGSGFIATFEYLIQPEDTPEGRLTDWAIQIGYTGDAQFNSSWMSGYNGGVNSGYNGPNGEYEITNVGAGYQPVSYTHLTLPTIYSV